MKTDLWNCETEYGLLQDIILKDAAQPSQYFQQLDNGEKIRNQILQKVIIERTYLRWLYIRLFELEEYLTLPSLNLWQRIVFNWKRRSLYFRPQTFDYLETVRVLNNRILHFHNAQTLADDQRVKSREFNILVRSIPETKRKINILRKARTKKEDALLLINDKSAYLELEF